MQNLIAACEVNDTPEYFLRSTFNVVRIEQQTDPSENFTYRLVLGACPDETKIFPAVTGIDGPPAMVRMGRHPTHSQFVIAEVTLPEASGGQYISFLSP